MRRGKKRVGFTLIELLVVIAIIGMLMGLLIPAAQRARETANKMKCASQVRQMAQAVQLYEQTRKNYPGYVNYVAMTNGTPFTNPTTGVRQGFSWAIELLPNLEQQNLYNAWRTPVGTTSGSTNITATSAQVRLDVFLCPTNPPAFSGGTPLAYVANTGCKDNTSQPTASLPRDWRENGIFFDRYTGDPRANAAGAGATQQMAAIVKMTSDFVTGRDGMSNTVMFSENVDAGQYSDACEQTLGFIWDHNATVTMVTPTPGGPPPTAVPSISSLRPNDFQSKGQGANTRSQSGGGSSSGGGSGSSTQTQNAMSSLPYDYTRPSSYHDGGVNVSFCDSRTAFMGEQIEYFVYCLLMSPDGKNVKAPGQTTLLSAQGSKNFGIPIDESWTNF